MNGPRTNMQDPAVQESIRRGPHRYATGDGVHGTYVKLEGGYKHQAYPKMMDRTPCPVRREFKFDSDFQEAFELWNQATSASVVENKAEEEAWTAAHKKTGKSEAVKPQTKSVKTAEAEPAKSEIAKAAS